MRINTLFLLLGGTASILVAAPAFAQSTDDRPFDGPYVGATVGYDFQGNDVGEKISFDRNGDGRFGDNVATAGGANAFSPGFCDGRAQGVNRSSGCENDRSGIGYDARIGFDKQFGHIVVGAVLEGGKSEVKDFVSGFSTTPAYYAITTKVDYNGSARGRLGYAFNKTLFYGTGGFAYARLGQRFETSNTANAFSASGGRNGYGYAAGGGVEQKIAKNVSFTVEYLRNDVKADRYVVHVAQGTAPVTNPFVLGGGTTDLERSDRRLAWQSIRAGVNFRF